jgi:hypothetical protein
MAESSKSAGAHHGKKNGAADETAPFYKKEIPERDGKLLGGFRAGECLREAALAAIRHIAVDDSAFGSLVERRVQSVELLFRRFGVPASESGAEFFLTRLDRGDHGGVAGVAFEALTRAFFGRFDVGHGIVGARGENRTPDQGLMSPLLYR